MSRTISLPHETFRAGRPGFTFVELLATTATTTLLIALLLPAVQGAREAARVATCQNNVRQIADAVLHHDASLGHLPSGGWGPGWLPVAERGGDSAQPGSWLYATLPYLDEAVTHASIEGATAATANATYTTLVTTAVPTLACPSRRTAAPRALPAAVKYRTPFGASQSVPSGVVTDYAANGGSTATCPPLDLLWKALAYVPGTTKVTFCHMPNNDPTKGNSQSLAISSIQNGHDGHDLDHVGPCATCDDDMATIASDPVSLAQGDQWRQLAPLARVVLPDAAIPDLQDGIVHRMSRITATAIRDGMSNTYLVGEKYVAADTYGPTATPDAGDDRPFVAGYSSTTVRWAYEPPARDARNRSQPNVFGSAHVAGWVVSLADGSVATCGFDIDPAVHQALAARNDGTFVTRPW